MSDKSKRCVLFMTFRPSQRTLFMVRRNWVPLALTPTFMIGQPWRHFRLTLYPFGGTAFAAFETNTSSSWTALATFEGFGLVWFDA